MWKLRMHRYHDGHDHHHGHHHPDEEALPPDTLTDPAHQSLVRAMRSSFNVLRVVMVLLVVAYALTGFIRVDQGQQGLVVRFGKLVKQDDGGYVVRPGTSFALPEPLDEKVIIPGAIQVHESRSFVFMRKPEDMGRPLSDVFPSNPTLRPDLDGAMLTGDQNLSHGIWKVEYRVEDADAFVSNISGAEGISDYLRQAAPVDAEKHEYQKLIARLFDQAIVRTVATRRVEEVAGAGKTVVGEQVKRVLQGLLEKHHTGIVVDKVVAEVVYPFQVRDSFNSVTNEENNAKKEKEGALQQAAAILTKTAGPNYAELTAAIDAYGAAQATGADEAKLSELRARIDGLLDQAEGDVAGALSYANGTATGIYESIKKEVTTFQSQREQYHRDPVMTTVRIWNDVRREVLQTIQNEMFFLPGIGDLELWTNRDLAKILQREKEDATKRIQGGGNR